MWCYVNWVLNTSSCGMKWGVRKVRKCVRSHISRETELRLVCDSHAFWPESEPAGEMEALSQTLPILQRPWAPPLSRDQFLRPSSWWLQFPLGITIAIKRWGWLHALSLQPSPMWWESQTGWCFLVPGLPRTEGVQGKMHPSKQAWWVPRLHNPSPAFPSAASLTHRQLLVSSQTCITDLISAPRARSITHTCYLCREGWISRVRLDLV